MASKEKNFKMIARNGRKKDLENFLIRKKM